VRTLRADAFILCDLRHRFAITPEETADLEILSAAYQKLCYCIVKATVPTVALTEPDLPVTVMV
jgi:hypothetical protein